MLSVFVFMSDTTRSRLVGHRFLPVYLLISRNYSLAPASNLAETRDVRSFPNEPSRIDPILPPFCSLPIAVYCLRHIPTNECISQRRFSYLWGRGPHHRKMAPKALPLDDQNRLIKASEKTNVWHVLTPSEARSETSTIAIPRPSRTPVRATVRKRHHPSLDDCGPVEYEESRAEFLALAHRLSGCRSLNRLNHNYGFSRSVRMWLDNDCVRGVGGCMYPVSLWAHGRYPFIGHASNECWTCRSRTSVEYRSRMAREVGRTSSGRVRRLRCDGGRGGQLDCGL